MSSLDVKIVIPVLNEVAYTKNCLEGLRRTGVSDSQVIIVNNGSTDGTADFLAQQPALTVITNPQNRGCGFAFNQGARAANASWVVLLNNDIIPTPGWLEGLLATALEEKFDIVSPALRNGKLDYDLDRLCADLLPRMAGLRRPGLAHGPCMMISRKVFETIGYFNDDPRLGGYEDDEFFRRARAAGFRLCITGRSFLHHFGQVTQKSLGAKLKVSGGFGDREYYRRLTGQTWWRRKYKRLCDEFYLNWCRRRERKACGQTLIESWPFVALPASPSGPKRDGSGQ